MIFEEEKKNKDNINIIKKVIRGYSRLLNKDDINYIKDYSLWRAISKYKNNSNMKFSTYLYNHVRWECLQYIKELSKKSQNLHRLREPSYRNNMKYVDLMLDINDEDKTFLIDRYIGRMSIEEIGKKHSIPRETARLKLIKIIEKIKNENHIVW